MNGSKESDDLKSRSSCPSLRKTSELFTFKRSSYLKDKRRFLQTVEDNDAFQYEELEDCESTTKKRGRNSKAFNEDDDFGEQISKRRKGDWDSECENKSGPVSLSSLRTTFKKEHRFNLTDY